MSKSRGLLLFLLCWTVCCGGARSELVQGSCWEGYKQCEVGACLLDKHICDGYAQCPDESDEKYCKGGTIPKPGDGPKLVQGNCPGGYVECKTGEVCLEEKYLCDGDFYCSDRSDEQFCEVNSTTKAPKTQLEQGICIDGYVECETEQICLQKKYVCDGNIYCPDKSDEKYCATKTEEPMTELTTISPDENTSTTTVSSEEEGNPNSEEKEHNFLLGEDVDHCAHYKRMILLVRRVHTRLAKMDSKTAKHIRHLINEILMEAGMENFSSLLELHHVCNNMNGVNHSRHHHRRHTTTTTPTTPS